VSHDEPWLDDDAGRLVRPYTVVNGRTRPTATLDLLSMMSTTGRVPRGQLDLDHSLALGLCRDPRSVAEIAAHLRMPAVVTKVLLSDLVDWGAVTARNPDPLANHAEPAVLEALLDGLQRRL
jgi:Protein of unknown function (DUF742)